MATSGKIEFVALCLKAAHLQPGALTPGGYVDFVKRDNLEQFADNEQGEEPRGSLRTTGLTADNIEPNSSMSLRTTGVTADNIDPNSSMSSRATGLTADNIDPTSSMSLRTTGVTGDTIDPNSSMPCGLLD